MKVKVTCIQCGKEFSVYPAWARKGRKFCSRECRWQWQRDHLKGESNPNFRGGNIELVCQWCGKKFEVLRWRAFRKFCSRACYAKAQGVQKRRYKMCKNCGKLFWKKRPKYFCSKKCEGEYKRGKNNPFYRGRFSEEAMRKIIKARHARPNRPESKLIHIINEYNLPFGYAGNGEVVIGGKNPDFIHTKGEKKVIELFGIYWHSPLYGKVRPTMTYEAKTQHYAKHGYDCLVIWDIELVNTRQVVDKIMKFAGGIKVAPLVVGE